MFPIWLAVSVWVPGVLRAAPGAGFAESLRPASWKGHTSVTNSAWNLFGKRLGSSGKMIRGSLCESRRFLKRSLRAFRNARHLSEILFSFSLQLNNTNLEAIDFLLPPTYETFSFTWEHRNQFGLMNGLKCERKKKNKECSPPSLGRRRLPSYKLVSELPNCINQRIESNQIQATKEFED